MFQTGDGKVHFVYKKVAVVENFFDIIYSVHVESAADTQVLYIYFLIAASLLLLLASPAAFRGLGSGVLPGKILLVRIIDNNKIDAYVRSG